MSGNRERSSRLSHALLAPAWAVRQASRALSEVTLEHLRAGLASGPEGHAPIRIVLEGRCGAGTDAGERRCGRVEVPLLALVPIPTPQVQEAAVELCWEYMGTSAPSAGSADAASMERRSLVGRPAVRREHARRGDRTPKIDVQLSLRGLAPPEGTQRVHDRVCTREGRPTPRA